MELGLITDDFHHCLFAHRLLYIVFTITSTFTVIITKCLTALQEYVGVLVTCESFLNIGINMHYCLFCSDGSLSMWHLVTSLLCYND